MKINKKFVVLVLIITLATLLFGCGAKSNSAMPASAPMATDSGSAANYAEQDMAIEEAGGSFGAGAAHAAPLESTEQKIIKNATLSLTAQDVQKIAQGIEKEAEQVRGFVANSAQFKGQSGKFRMEMTLRIPAGKFANFLTYLEGLGTVEQKRIYTDDVTEQYIDLAAKVKSLTIQEARLQDILSKATKVEDLLRIEQELGRVRGEIDAYTGQLRYLTDKVDFSTIELTLLDTGLQQEKVNVNNISGTWGNSIAAFIASINGLLQTSSSLVVMFFALLPHLVVLGLLVILLLALKRRLKTKREENL